MSIEELKARQASAAAPKEADGGTTAAVQAALAEPTPAVQESPHEAEAARKKRLEQFSRIRVGSTLANEEALGNSGFDAAITADNVRLALDAGELVIDTDVAERFDSVKPLFKEESGREVWAVYMTRGEHNIKLMLKGANGKTEQVQFTNNVLFVYSKRTRDMIEAELATDNATQAFSQHIVRCTRDQARHLIDLQKQAQRSVTTPGAMSTAFIRASEGVLASAMAAAKGTVLHGGRDNGLSGFGV